MLSKLFLLCCMSFLLIYTSNHCIIWLLSLISVLILKIPLMHVKSKQNSLNVLKLDKTENCIQQKWCYSLFFKHSCITRVSGRYASLTLVVFIQNKDTHRDIQRDKDTDKHCFAVNIASTGIHSLLYMFSTNP